MSSRRRPDGRGVDPKYRAARAQGAMWPIAERADSLPESIDWTQWRQCPVCWAKIGQACRVLSGTRVVDAERPHGTRKRRTGS